MAYSLIWLPEVLKKAGLKVALVDGWETRGHHDVGPTYGVICHHTATSDPHRRRPNMATLNTLLKGRSDLPGPLSQLALGRDGTYYVLAAGKCYHAGGGIWQGFADGNANFIGIEAENTGGADDFPWPAVQMEAYHRGVAAILRYIGRSAKYCAAHREYALPRGRKSDPVFDMVAFRAAVADILAGTAAAPELIPAMEPAVPGKTARPTLRRGDKNPFVKELQLKIGIAPADADGDFGAKTEATLRVFQRAHGMVADSIAGPKTWLAMDKMPT